MAIRAISRGASIAGRKVLPSSSSGSSTATSNSSVPCSLIEHRRWLQLSPRSNSSHSADLVSAANAESSLSTKQVPAASSWVLKFSSTQIRRLKHIILSCSYSLDPSSSSAYTAIQGTTCSGIATAVVRNPLLFAYIIFVIFFPHSYLAIASPVMRLSRRFVNAF